MSGGPQARRLHIKTYGCQMNVYDSERMTDLLAEQGYVASDNADGADLVILNTCHIREHAAEKVYSELGRLREMREARLASDGGRMTIAVAGCVAQAQGAEIMNRQPAVDLVVGPQAYDRLPQMLTEIGSAGAGSPRSARLADAFAPQAKFQALPPGRRTSGPAAFLTVQEGCDKFCSFCVVPYTRGAEYSRPVEAIIAEARRLADGGVREITLLGQNVNAYTGEDDAGRRVGLAQLIRRLADIADVARIRYTTSHPRDMDDDLIDAHTEFSALMPYLHLPVQSGSDRMLKAMNRGHTAAEYLDLVRRIRAARPDIALSSDFIVGFPGETEADFEATLSLVRAVGYVQAFSFKYSRRPGTPANDLGGQIPEPVKAARLGRLQVLLDGQTRAFNQGCVGRTLPVLFDRFGRKAGQVCGRTPYLQPVWVQGPAELIGRIAEVEVLACGAGSLQGRLAVAHATEPA